MIVRSVRPIDVGALRGLLQRSGTVEYTTHTWPKVQPESGPLPLGALLGQALGRHGSRFGGWVTLDGGQLSGFIAARSRCDGLSWDVEHLHADDEAAAVALLEQVSDTAANHGARRIFVDAVPELGERVWRRAGFSRYAESTLLVGKSLIVRSGQAIFAARPRLRADEQALFRLYSQAVPANVRAAEAMTQEEWLALHRGGRRWQPSVLGDRHQFVWELGTGLAGWLEVVYGQKSQYLEFLVDPLYDTVLDRLSGYALTQVNTRAPVYATVRDYQPALEATLRRVGFTAATEAHILVRQLTQRVLESKMLPVQAVGG